MIKKRIDQLPGFFVNHFVVDTSGKFTTCVVDTGEKIAAGGIVINVNHVKSIITGVVDMHRGSPSMMPAVNLPLVSRTPALHLELRKSSQAFE